MLAKLLKILLKNVICIQVICFYSTPFSYAQICIPSEECVPVGKPYVNYSLGNCYGLLDRYLSKSIMFTGIIDQLGLPEYCDHINLLKELQPAYISRVAGEWGAPETNFLPGGVIHTKCVQVINDINKVYCSLGLRLPIIEAGILRSNYI